MALIWLRIPELARFHVSTKAAPSRSGIAGAAEQVALDSAHVKAHRCAGGGKRPSERAIGVAKGRRNSKLHALVDKLCRPCGQSFLTPGDVAGYTV